MSETDEPMISVKVSVAIPFQTWQDTVADATKVTDRIGPLALQLREALNAPRAELAELVNLKESTLADLELGRRKPTLIETAYLLTGLRVLWEDKGGEIRAGVTAPAAGSPPPDEAPDGGPPE